MKIAINGQIVDTDTIFSISENVYDNGKEFFFDIIFFDERSIEISINKEDRNNNKAHEEYHQFRLLKGIDASEEDMITAKTIWKNIPVINKEKIEKMRQDIVNVWSENQSKIPSFDIKKY